jgi:hypothetical protein
MVRPVARPGIRTPSIPRIPANVQTPSQSTQPLDQSQASLGGQQLSAGGNPFASNISRNIATPTGNLTVSFQRTASGYKPVAITQNRTYSVPVKAAAGNIQATGLQTFTYAIKGNQIVSVNKNAKGNVTYNGQQIGTLAPNGGINITPGATVTQPQYGTINGKSQLLGNLVLTPSYANGQITLTPSGFEAASITISGTQTVYNASGLPQKIGYQYPAIVTYNKATNSLTVAPQGLYGPGTSPLPISNLYLSPQTATVFRPGLGTSSITYNVQVNPNTATQILNISSIGAAALTPSTPPPILVTGTSQPYLAFSGGTIAIGSIPEVTTSFNASVATGSTANLVGSNLFDFSLFGNGSPLPKQPTKLAATAQQVPLYNFTIPLQPSQYQGTKSTIVSYPSYTGLLPGGGIVSYGGPTVGSLTQNLLAGFGLKAPQGTATIGNIAYGVAYYTLAQPVSFYGSYELGQATAMENPNATLSSKLGSITNYAQQTFISSLPPEQVATIIQGVRTQGALRTAEQVGGAFIFYGGIGAAAKLGIGAYEEVVPVPKGAGSIGASVISIKATAYGEPGLAVTKGGITATDLVSIVNAKSGELGAVAFEGGYKITYSNAEAVTELQGVAKTITSTNMQGQEETFFRVGTQTATKTTIIYSSIRGGKIGNLFGIGPRVLEGEPIVSRTPSAIVTDLTIPNAEFVQLGVRRNIVMEGELPNSYVTTLQSSDTGSFLRLTGKTTKGTEYSGLGAVVDGFNKEGTAIEIQPVKFTIVEGKELMSFNELSNAAPLPLEGRGYTGPPSKEPIIKPPAVQESSLAPTTPTSIPTIETPSKGGSGTVEVARTSFKTQIAAQVNIDVFDESTPSAGAKLLTTSIIRTLPIVSKTSRNPVRSINVTVQPSRTVGILGRVSSTLTPTKNIPTQKGGIISSQKSAFHNATGLSNRLGMSNKNINIETQRSTMRQSQRNSTRQASMLQSTATTPPSATGLRDIPTLLPGRPVLTRLKKSITNQFRINPKFGSTADVTHAVLRQYGSSRRVTKRLRKIGFSRPL